MCLSICTQLIYNLYIFPFLFSYLPITHLCFSLHPSINYQFIHRLRKIRCPYKLLILIGKTTSKIHQVFSGLVE